MRNGGFNGVYSRASDWLADTARTRPEALLLVGAGCALLLGGGLRAWAQPEEPDEEESPRKTSAGNGRKAAREEDLGDRLGEYAGAAASSAASVSGRVTRQAGATIQDTIARVIREQPLAVVAAGLAAGALTAAFLPRTEIEEQTMGDLGQALYDTAAQAGTNLKDAAAAAGERLKDSAREHGLSTDGVKEMARDAAETFAATATGGREEPAPRPSALRGEPG